MKRIKVRWVMLVAVCAGLLTLASCDIPKEVKTVLQKGYTVSAGAEQVLEALLANEELTPEQKEDVQMALEGVRALRNSIELALRILDITSPRQFESGATRGERSVNLRQAINELNDAAWRAEKEM